jgi:hypothetical protein
MFMSASPPPISCYTITKAGGGNMRWLTGLARSAGPMWWLSTTISVARAVGLSGQGSSASWWRSARAVEASRLARNGRDWHTLLEFCGLVGCLLADEDGVYDPRLPNDRLLLGMKGTMSEMELSLLRQRSFEALHQKARRGELFFTVAVGYRKARHDRIEMEPDLRVREAIALVFRKFSEFRSVRQVHLWLRQEEIRLPAVEHGSLGPQVVWKLPVYNTILHLLTNPIYGGAYAFGRTCSRVSVRDGRKRVVRGFRRSQTEWEVLSPITTTDTSRGRSSEGTSA